MTRMNSLPAEARSVSARAVGKRRRASRALAAQRMRVSATHRTSFVTPAARARRRRLRSAVPDGCVKRATGRGGREVLPKCQFVRPSRARSGALRVRRTLAARAMMTQTPAALPATPMSSRLHRLPPPPPPLTPGRPGLDRVLDLVTEHETHYRQQARAALRCIALRPALRLGQQVPDSAATAALAAPGAAHGRAFEAASRLRGAAGPRVRHGRRSGLLPQLVSRLPALR